MSQNTYSTPLTLVNSSLGEGLLVKSNAIYWLDITKSLLYIRCFSGDEISFQLPEQASDIWKVEKERYIYLASESGLVLFDAVSEQWSLISRLPKIKHSIRANDGGSFSSDIYCFGTMSKKGIKSKGSLYIYNGREITHVFSKISIPNTFVKLNATQMLISDSLEKVIYKFSFSKDYSKVLEQKVWVDHRVDNLIPDGGCIDSNGNIYIAIWDGFCINKYNRDGKLLAKLNIDVPRPTNCKLDVDESKLYVTTASEGLTEEEILLYPKSGCLLEVNLAK
jgi:sugar lactone lactonase YvrE